MLALSPRFAILATFCSLAAVTLSPMSAMAAAVEPRHSAGKEGTTPAHQKHPVLPMPASVMKKAKSAAAKKGSEKEKASPSADEKHKSGKGRFKVREYDFGAPRDYVTVEPRHRHHRYKEIIIGGKDAHIRVGRGHHSDHGGEKVIVKGKDAHIHVERHNHGWHGDKVIIKSDDAHVHVHQRRSIVIPNVDGRSYLVSHTRRVPGHWHHGHHNVVVVDDRDIGHQATFKARRDEQGTSGTVGIMNDVYNSTGGREMAGLVLDTSNDKYVLNASDTNRTVVYLVKASIPPSHDTAASSADSDVPVFLQMLISSNSSSTPVPHCATYDPNPPQAEPLTMTPCKNTTTAEAHESQLFAYNEQTGAIHPMWFSDDGTTNGTSSSAPLGDANSWNSTASSNGTMSSNSTTPSNSTTSAATASSTPGPFGRRQSGGSQNVTLVFVADGATVESVQDPSSSLNGTTTTATVTVVSTASESASTQSLSVADITSATEEPASSTLSSGSLTSSATSVASTMDSASPSSTSAGALKVEVVSPNDSSSVSTTPSTTSTSTTLASSSIDAAAVASSIAASNAAASSSSTIDASSSPTPAPTTVAISGRDGVAA